MYYRVAAVVLVAISVGVFGCADGAREKVEFRPPSNSNTLDRKVVALEQGMSLESVRAILGEPLNERSPSDSEVQMLFYGRWQLLFENGLLDRRIKYVSERPLPDPRVVDQHEQALDQKILSLKPGTSMSAVKSKLGPPETYEIIQNKPHKEEILTYELWELTFVRGKLQRRNKR